jgi:hypothetical protein
MIMTGMLTQSTTRRNSFVAPAPPAVASFRRPREDSWTEDFPMLHDTIRFVPDEYAALGSKRHTARYNGYEVGVQVMSHPMTDNSNDRAKKLMALHLEANIRKSVMGMGHGQYLKPTELRNLQSGEIMLTTNVEGSHYKIPLKVNARGEYRTDLSHQTFHSLRDAVTFVMDGIFEHKGVDNMYKQSSAAHRHQARAEQSIRPTHAAPAMRM